MFTLQVRQAGLVLKGSDISNGDESTIPITQNCGADTESYSSITVGASSQCYQDELILLKVLANAIKVWANARKVWPKASKFWANASKMSD